MATVLLITTNKTMEIRTIKLARSTDGRNRVLTLQVSDNFYHISINNNSDTAEQYPLGQIEKAFNRFHKAANEMGLSVEI